MCKKIRALYPDEVEVRVAQTTAKGIQLLLYKDSRVDMRILDEVFGVTGWRNKFEKIGDDLFCTIEIWDEEKKEWIPKCNCGTEGNVGEGKSTASDAIKRAGTVVGIGRELYTKAIKPIFVKVPTVARQNGKGYEVADSHKYVTYSVTHMKVDEESEKIVELEITNSNGELVYSYGMPRKNASKVNTPKTNEIPTEGDFEGIEILSVGKEEIQWLKDNYDEDILPKICEKYHVEEIAALSMDQFAQIKAKFEASKK
jgi:hypothetical protein